MNHIFSGSFVRGEETYDYSGIWTPVGPRIAWKAIVRNADVVCRPSGELDDGLNPEEIIDTITKAIEASTDAVRRP